MREALSVVRIAAGYGRGDVLHEVSLVAHAGTAVAILGANGAGKTTLARVIVGLMLPSSGSVLLDGIDVSRWPADRRARYGLGYVPEGRMVFPGLSVEENLAVGAMAARGRAAADVNQILALFPRLRERRRQMAQTLSGGEQQMLALARALMGNPRFLVLDEPSLGLAPRLAHEFYQALHRVLAERSLAAVVIEQHVTMALSLCSYAYVLQNGQVMGQGDSVSLRRDPTVLEAYLGKA